MKLSSFVLAAGSLQNVMTSESICQDSNPAYCELHKDEYCGDFYYRQTCKSTCRSCDEKIPIGPQICLDRVQCSNLKVLCFKPTILNGKCDRTCGFCSSPEQTPPDSSLTTSSSISSTTSPDPAETNDLDEVMDELYELYDLYNSTDNYVPDENDPSILEVVSSNMIVYHDDTPRNAPFPDFECDKNEYKIKIETHSDLWSGTDDDVQIRIGYEWFDLGNLKQPGFPNSNILERLSVDEFCARPSNEYLPELPLTIGLRKFGNDDLKIRSIQISTWRESFQYTGTPEWIKDSVVKEYFRIVPGFFW